MIWFSVWRCKWWFVAMQWIFVCSGSHNKNSGDSGKLKRLMGKNNACCHSNLWICIKLLIQWTSSGMFIKFLQMLLLWSYQREHVQTLLRTWKENIFKDVFHLYYSSSPKFWDIHLKPWLWRSPSLIELESWCRNNNGSKSTNAWHNHEHHPNDNDCLHDAPKEC